MVESWERSGYLNCLNMMNEVGGNLVRSGPCGRSCSRLWGDDSLVLGKDREIFDKVGVGLVRRDHAGSSCCATGKLCGGM